MKPRLVDLFTFDRELDDLVLSRYPGKIFENQHHVDDSISGKRLYCFYNLEFSELARFIKPLNFSYEIRNSRTGEFVNIARKRNPRQRISAN